MAHNQPTPISSARLSANPPLPKQAMRADDQVPLVSFQGLAHYQRVTGRVPLRLNISSSRLVKSVLLAVDGKPVAELNGAPWEAVWDSSSAEFGWHMITARVVDNQGLSNFCTINVMTERPRL